jgi:hypothetical protein
MIMKRNTVLKVLNPVLLLFFINQATTVLFIDHLSPGTFGLFHKTGGAIFLCLIAIHFILNFNWIKANYFPHK